MSRYKVELAPRARRDLAALPRDVQARLGSAIDGLADEPRPPGARKLRGDDAWRVRVGDYRILYDIEDARLRVLVLAMGHRREVYRR